MPRSRPLLLAVLVGAAVLLQAPVVDRVALPGGRPQLLVVVVTAIALADGPRAGMVAGFAGGLLADLTPPSVAPLGTSALVLVLVGALAGALRRRVAGVPGSLGVVALATVAALAGAVAVGAVLGQPVGPAAQVAAAVGGAAAYDVVLASFLLALVRAGRRSPGRWSAAGAGAGS